MKVKVLFFGILSEIAGCNEQLIKDVGTVGDLKTLLSAQYPTFGNYQFQTSVNQIISKDSKKLGNNDEIALLPPFAGG